MREGGGHKTGLTNRKNPAKPAYPKVSLPRPAVEACKGRAKNRIGTVFCRNFSQVVKPGPFFFRDPQRIAVEKNEVNDYCQIGTAALRCLDC